MYQKENLIQALKEQISVYVTRLFLDNQNPTLLYHNLTHTESVVKRSAEIAAYYSIHEVSLFALVTAAWFHDTGQLFKYGKDHETESVSIMNNFLKGKNVEASLIHTIEGCILATRMPHEPKSFLEEIICAADTFNLGTDSFLETDQLLREECELKEEKKIDDWDLKTLKLLESHKYFTSYCQQMLNKGKQKNIKMIRSKLNLT